MQNDDMRPALRARIKKIEDDLTYWKGVLERENAAFGASFSPSSEGASSSYKLEDMPKVILNILKGESLEKQTLIKKIAEIPPFSGLDAPGRNVHAQLNNLIRTKRVEFNGDKYVYVRD